jgi:hypothetical protein
MPIVTDPRKEHGVPRRRAEVDRPAAYDRQRMSPRRAPAESLRTITIRVRDLATHQVEESTLERWVPPDDQGAREVLVEAVEARHPGARARARSYVDGVISFLLPGQLIVAALGEARARRQPRADPQLFERDVA